MERPFPCTPTLFWGPDAERWPRAEVSDPVVLCHVPRSAHFLAGLSLALPLLEHPRGPPPEVKWPRRGERRPPPCLRCRAGWLISPRGTFQTRNLRHTGEAGPGSPPSKAAVTTRAGHQSSPGGAAGAWAPPACSSGAEGPGARHPDSTAAWLCTVFKKFLAPSKIRKFWKSGNDA